MAVTELKTLYSISGAKLQKNFEVLDSKIAGGLKKIINGNFTRRVFIQEEAAQKEKRSLTGGQVACIIYQNLEVRDTDKSILDFQEILKVQLNNDNVQSFSTG